MAFLIENNRKSSTIKSYVSAIRVVLKRLGIHICKNNEVLATLIRACRLKNDVIQTRLPIRRGLLEVLIKSIAKCFKSPQLYLVILYKAFMTTAYFGLFRVGELTESEHVVKAWDIHIALNKDKLMFILHTSKTHNQGSKPQIIKIEGVMETSAGSNRTLIVCLFKLLQDYLKVRPKYDHELEQFFIF